MILDDIVAAKTKELEKTKRHVPKEALERRMAHTSIRGFGKALKETKDISIIAEVKKASPSKGIIREDFNPVEIARSYEEAKVDAISVLTEQSFFLGKKEYLTQIKQETTVPVLRKDFIIDEYQIVEGKALGADALLLIVSILDEAKLQKFIEYTAQLHMSALVEVHSKDELKRALGCGAEIIGINNRNLKTFETSLEHTEEIMAFMPKGKTVVSESGIHTREDMAYMRDLGVHGVLVGESLMKAVSIPNKIHELRGCL